MTTAEQRHNFDHAFELVEGGESMVITRHGKPVAILMPYEDFKRLQDILGDDEEPEPLTDEEWNPYAEALGIEPDKGGQREEQSEH